MDDYRALDLHALAIPVDEVRQSIFRVKNIIRVMQCEFRIREKEKSSTHDIEFFARVPFTMRRDLGFTLFSVASVMRGADDRLHRQLLGSSVPGVTIKSNERKVPSSSARNVCDKILHSKFSTFYSIDVVQNELWIDLYGARFDTERRAGQEDWLLRVPIMSYLRSCEEALSLYERIERSIDISHWLKANRSKARKTLASSSLLGLLGLDQEPAQQ